MNINRTKKIVYIGIFIALEVILTRFLSIQTPIVRIGFTFLPIAISAMMFGPLYGGIIAAIADLVGMMIFPSGGAYFPGFTFSAFLTGAIFGVFLYRKQVTFIRTCLAVITVTVVITLCLDTGWLWMITGQAVKALLPARIIKCFVMVPIQVFMIRTMWRYLNTTIKLNTTEA